MKTRTTDLTKEEIGIELITGLWSSLDSHLPYCIDSSPEGQAFHRRCVREYADLIQLAAKLMHQKKAS